MQEAVKNTQHRKSFCDSKQIDENGNCASSEKFDSRMRYAYCEVRLQRIDIDGVGRSLSNLRIASTAAGSEKEIIRLAGRIINIIPGMNIAVVQPLSSIDLLYLGTPLYSTNSDRLGRIDDIFGSIQEPMYSVELISAQQSGSKIGDDVYYSVNDPRTRLMRVENTEEQNAVKHKITTRSV